MRGVCILKRSGLLSQFPDPLVTCLVGYILVLPCLPEETRQEFQTQLPLLKGAAFRQALLDCMLLQLVN